MTNDSMSQQAETRRLTDAEMVEIMRGYPRRVKPASRSVSLLVVFVVACAAALLGFLIGLDPMGLYVAEVLK